VGGWCKEWHNKNENCQLEGLHQKPSQMERIPWEGQNFPEVVAPKEEEEEEEVIQLSFNFRSLNMQQQEQLTLNKFSYKSSGRPFVGGSWFSVPVEAFVVDSATLPTLAWLLGTLPETDDPVSPPKVELPPGLLAWANIPTSGPPFRVSPSPTLALYPPSDADTSLPDSCNLEIWNVRRWLFECCHRLDYFTLISGT
jgi:hypothetical protein